MGLIDVEHLVKEFHIGPKSVVHAVNDVSFGVDEGETLGLVGESGSGKTTVGRCILRTVEPTSGAILFEGRDLLGLGRRELRQVRRKIQIVFQDPFDALDPRMTVGEVIREPLRAQKAGSGFEQRKEVLRLAAAVGLPRRLLGHLPRELSMGQQQRAGVARAIATRPRAIILDEAVSNLDSTARFELIELLKELQREMGLTYVFISHDLNTVRYISSRVAIMYLGRIVEIGSADQIFRHQLHPYSRALLSAALFPDPQRKRSPYALQGEIPSPTSLPVGCFLHPRCPEAVPACRVEYPPMIEGEPNHRASCFWIDPSTFPEDPSTADSSSERRGLEHASR